MKQISTSINNNNLRKEVLEALFSSYKGDSFSAAEIGYNKRAVLLHLGGGVPVALCNPVVEYYRQNEDYAHVVPSEGVVVQVTAEYYRQSDDYWLSKDPVTLVLYGQEAEDVLKAMRYLDAAQVSDSVDINISAKDFTRSADK